MPRSITIDGVQVIQVSLVRDQSGQIHVYCEYHLKAGNQVIQANHQEITPRLSAARKTGALAIFDAIAQDVAAVELA
ncbi:MAG: hypothetical protein HYY04_00435 [Chloroflexi bacterium]|nr:hypothetical protein [Chloroflexota bacterium]